jgi:hypothetical protein
MGATLPSESPAVIRREWTLVRGASASTPKTKRSISRARELASWGIDAEDLRENVEGSREAAEEIGAPLSSPVIEREARGHTAPTWGRVTSAPRSRGDRSTVATPHTSRHDCFRATSVWPLGLADKMRDPGDQQIVCARSTDCSFAAVQRVANTWISAGIALGTPSA